VNVDTTEAVAVFLLAVVPGVLALELFEWGRPAIREREKVRTLARYVLVSATVWGAAAIVFDAGGQLKDLIRIGCRAECEGTDAVDSYLGLAIDLGVTAMAVGIGVRFLMWLGARAGFWLLLAAQGRKGRLMTFLGRALASSVTTAQAWDELLRKLQRDGRAQLAHVRLTDGRSVYGVFAGGGRADFDAEGRGLLLDQELVEGSAGLEPVKESTGLYISPDQLASVSFAAFPKQESASVESSADE